MLFVLPALSLQAVGWLMLAAAVVLAVRLEVARRRLAGIPGPWAAQYTDLWRYRAQNSPGWSRRLLALHRQHGRLVRLGPGHVSVSDPAAVPVVYGTSPVWPKGPSYDAAAGVSNGRRVPSIIAMGEAQHTAVRKAAGRAFTTNSLLDYEAAIDTAVADFVQRLGAQAAAAGGTVDIGFWLQLFAMDVLMRIAFSESPGLMDRGADVDGLLAAVIARFDHWNAWAAVPGLDYALNKSRLSCWLRGSPNSPLARVSLAKLVGRRAAKARSAADGDKEGGAARDPEAARKDLLEKFLDGQTRFPELVSDDEVLGIIMSTIGAGADTTASTLTYTLVLLSRHPAAAAALRAELDAARAAGALSHPPRWTEVNRLPYLDAVLKESMRISPVAAWGLDRIVPPAGATLAGRFLPGGTVVGCQIDAIHRDESVYGADADAFRPERWLEAGEDQRRRMDRAFLAFSAGKRTCTGLHIAWLEMKKTLPLVLMNFDIDLVNPDQNIDDSIRISAVKYPPPIWAKVHKKGVPLGLEKTDTVSA